MSYANRPSLARKEQSEIDYHTKRIAKVKIPDKPLAQMTREEKNWVIKGKRCKHCPSKVYYPYHVCFSCNQRIKLGLKPGKKDVKEQETKDY